MTSLRAGTRALGLSVTWRYAFVPAGSNLQVCRDAVVLDVGGQLAHGMLDQHHDATVGASTAELVIRYPEYAYGHLMDGWLTRRDDGQELRGRHWSPVLVTHRHPDFDAVVSCFLLRRLIEDGELPIYARALAGYSSQVDQGRYKVDVQRPETATHALHMAYLALQNVPAPAGLDADTWHIERGFDLLETAMAALAEARGGDLSRLLPEHLYPHQSGAAAWRDVPRFGDLRQLLDDDHLAYLEDRKHAILLPGVELPVADGLGSLAVPTFIGAGPPRSKLNKYWVRAEGYPYFICPYASWNHRNADVVDGKDRFPRAILSLDPTWSDATGRRPTLRGLGFQLEAHEAAARRMLEGGDTRIRQQRWTDGSVDNDDPWYDGRGHEHTIIDAPRSGTYLTYDAVQAIARSRFWHVPMKLAVVHVLLPADDEQVPTSAGRPAKPDMAMRCLEPWFEDCREWDVASPPPFDLPAGFVVDCHRIRVFPEQLSPAMRVVRLRLGLPGVGTATLDELAAWAEDLNKRYKNTPYLISHVRVGDGQSPERVRAMLDQLCFGQVRAPEGPQGSDLVLYNRRAIAVQPATAAAGMSAHDGDTLLELLLYSAFQAEALAGFSTQAADAVSSAKRITGGRQLRRRFLRFTARHFHVEVLRGEAIRHVYAGLREALGLERLHDKVSEEVDLLEQLERNASDRKKDLLLFLVGLAGLQQAWFSSWGEYSQLQTGSFLAVGTVLTAGFWLLVREPKAA